MKLKEARIGDKRMEGGRGQGEGGESEGEGEGGREGGRERGREKKGGKSGGSVRWCFHYRRILDILTHGITKTDREAQQYENCHGSEDGSYKTLEMADCK